MQHLFVAACKCRLMEALLAGFIMGDCSLAQGYTQIGTVEILTGGPAVYD